MWYFSPFLISWFHFQSLCPSVLCLFQVFLSVVTVRFVHAFTSLKWCSYSLYPDTILRCLCNVVQLTGLLLKDILGWDDFINFPPIIPSCPCLLRLELKHSCLETLVFVVMTCSSINVMNYGKKDARHQQVTQICF